MTNSEISTLKQPRGLYNLFFVEMWERYGFYSVQLLFALYLTKVCHFSDCQAYDLFSAYSALIYATPVIGGYLADKYIGFRHAIFLGGFLYLIGYILLAFGNHNQFFIALALLISGNGFFKSCVSSLLGTLYSDNDPRRDSGFTIFYMGINFGSAFAPLITTYLSTNYGWSYGFASAGIGMIIAIITFYFGLKSLDRHGLPPNNNEFAKKKFFGINATYILYFSVIVFIALISLLIQHSKLVDRVFELFSILVIALVIGITLRQKPEQRSKMLVMITLIIFSMIFWALYAQFYSTYALFIDRVVDRHIFQWTIPTGYILSLEGFLIILFSPILAFIWLKLAAARHNPSSPFKFSLGLILIGISFLTISLSVLFANSSGLTNIWWVIFSFVLLVFGELFLSPTGLSMITTLTPPKYTGMMMGVWFLSISAGFSIGDFIEDKMNVPKQITDIHVISHIYSHGFWILGWSAIVIGGVLLAFSPKLYQLIKKYE